MQTTSRKTTWILKLTLLSSAVMLAALCGCHNRAYNELYMENMAAEIRDLEDQLYEFDYEYRQLEHQLASLRAENARLRDVTGNRESVPAGPSNSDDNRGAYSKQQSILEPAVELPDDFSSDDLLAPSIPGNRPNSDRSEGNLRDTPSTSPQPAPRRESIEPEFDTEDLLPPTIEPGEPMPPQQPLGADRSDGNQANMNALELNLSRIEVPAKLASQSIALESDATLSDRQGSSEAAIEPQGQITQVPSDVMELATIKPATPLVQDDRVVELAFHPTLSRAANFDDEADDDGLYLVLQPLNEAGQMVPVAADLSIVILDPSREGSQSRIGRRDYSANEVKAKMQAAGASQGIHLRMPWNGPDPDADRVLVFVRYTFPDGRQVIGEKTFFVDGEGGLKTVWAPRSQGNSSSSQPSSVASADENTPKNAGVSFAGGRADANHSSVVRPAVGTSTAKYPPTPDEAHR